MDGIRWILRKKLPAAIQELTILNAEGNLRSATLAETENWKKIEKVKLVAKKSTVLQKSSDQTIEQKFDNLIFSHTFISKWNLNNYTS